MASATIQLVIKAKDEASAKLRRVSGSLNDTNTSLGKFNKLAGAGALAAGGLAIALGVRAVQAAMAFEKSMTNVSTLIDTDIESMEEMTDAVIELGTRIPVELGDMSSALYDVRSAGTDAADAMKVLELSAKLGVAGLGTTKESADLLTTAMNAFGLEADKVDEHADVLFKTVKAGKTDIAKLSQAFGKMAGNAKAANIQFVDTQAATAAITALTGKTSEAQNGLAQIFLELTIAGGKLDKALIDNGSSLIELNKAIQEDGLVKGMKELQEQMGLSETEFKNQFSSAEGGTVAYQLLTDAYEMNNEALADMTSGVNKMEEGFEKQNEASWAQYQILKNNLSIVLIDLGNKIIPHLIDVVDRMKYFPDLMNRWWKQAKNVWDILMKVMNVVEWIVNPLAKLTKHFNLAGKQMDFMKRIAGDLIEKFHKLKDAWDKVRDFVTGGGGNRQFGGAVTRGQAVMVGEHRPEVFVPSQSGNIRQVGQGGGGKEITVNFNNVSVRSDSDLESIVQAVKATLNQEQEYNAIGAR